MKKQIVGKITKKGDKWTVVTPWGLHEAKSLRSANVIRLRARDVFKMILKEKLWGQAMLDSMKL